MSLLLPGFLNVSKYHNVVLKDGANSEPALKSGFFEGRSIALLQCRGKNQIKNDCTKGLFLNALGKEYGTEIAFFLMSKLEMNTTKPLSGRLIRAVVADAEAMAKEVASFNAVAVSDFIRDRNGATLLLKGYSDQGWFGEAKINHFQQVLTAEVAKFKDPLQRVGIEALAESTLNKIEMLEQDIHDDYKQYGEAFRSNSHCTILAALDQLAEHIQLRAQLDISGTLNAGAENGVDDKVKYQQRVMATLIKGLSFDEKRALLELILNHPTSKEVVQLLGGGGTGFAMNTMESAQFSEDDPIVLLNKLCRTETTLNALLSVLDMQICDSTEISPRLKGWFNVRAGEQTSGRIEYADPAFAKAFIDLQRDHNGVDTDRFGLSDIVPGGHCKQYLVINTDDRFKEYLSTLSNLKSEAMHEVYVKDFSRNNYYVDGRQVSKNLDEEGGPDVAKDDINAVPLIATRFAHQGIFADLLISLSEQYGLFLLDDPNNCSSTYSLWRLPNNDIQLHAHHTAGVALLSKEAPSSDQQLDVEKSSRSVEVNILIKQKDDKVSATLSSPIIYEYRAVPLEG